MNRSKRILFLFAIVFFVILAIIAFDMASKTTFPGEKNKTEINKNEQDSVQNNKNTY